MDVFIDNAVNGEWIRYNSLEKLHVYVYISPVEDDIVRVKLVVLHNLAGITVLPNFIAA